MVATVSMESQQIFSSLGLNEFANLAIVATEIGGVNCDAIATITADGDNRLITPIAIIVNEALFSRLVQP